MFRQILPIAVLFALGLKHGLGGDHLTAIAALAASGARRGARAGRLALLGVRFGLGHALTLLVAGGGVLLVGWTLSERFERNAELGGAALLILLGTWLLVDLRRGKLHLHAHAHDHGDGNVHEHLHLHVAPAAASDDHHPTLALALGGLFSLSGVRSILLAVPLLVPHGWHGLVLGALAFGVGVMTTMAAAGAAAAGLLRGGASTTTMAWTAQALAAVLSLGVGFYWAAAHW